MNGRHDHKRKKKKDAGRRTVSPRQETMCQEHPDGAKEDQMTKATDNPPHSRWAAAAFFVSIAAFCATFAQAYYTRQALLVDQRAWVGPGNMVAGEMAVSVPLTNTGKTPALHVSSVYGPVQWCCDPKNMPPNPTQGDTDSARDQGILMPGASSFLNIKVLDFESFITSATKLKMIQELRGRVDYSDIFGKKHWTRFCFGTIGPPEVGFGPNKLNTNYRFKQCTHGNDTDEHPEPDPPGIRELYTP